VSPQIKEAASSSNLTLLVAAVRIRGRAVRE
jgi:hypothetical protein